jgi:ABC-2 type transport system permease protein
MKINRLLAVVKREFKERVMKKSFLIFTLITPLLFGALMVVPSLLWMVKSEKVNKIVVFDKSGFMYDGLVSFKSEAKEEREKKEDFASQIEFVKPPQNADLKSYIRKVGDENSEIDGVLEIYTEENGKVVSTFYGRNISNIKLVSTLERNLNSILLNTLLKKNNISEEVANELKKKVELKAVKVEKGGKTKESSFLKEYLKTFFVSMLLYMLIIGYGQTLMRGVMEEKSSRVVEMLLSSLKPSELLLGKVLGIATVGLLQYLIWVLCGVVLFIFNPANFTSSLEKGFIKPEEVALFLVFFVLGFFFYASVFAAMGSVCSTDQEVQQLMLPIVLILIFPVLILGMILQNPNAGWIVALSLIPLFSPTLMMTRIAIMSVPIWQVIASIAILAFGVVFMAWLGGKIYRTGILMTGKRPTIFELIKWIRA